MAISIERYQCAHERAVQTFNERLRAGQPDENLVFYPSSRPAWLPKRGEGDPYNEFFVAVDGAAVRGAYALKWQRFLFADGRERAIACYHHPLSEGIIDKSYASVGALLLRHALGRAQLLYCLGMGGYERPLPRMLIALGWSHTRIPFYVKIVHPFRFLREMKALRASWWRRGVLDAAAFTGTGWLGWQAWRTFRGWRSPRPEPSSVESVQEYSEWSDVLWRESKDGYALAAVRDAGALRALYPASATHLVRLRIVRNGTPIGWAAIGQRRRDAKYGAMRVGSIVDCWARAGDELPVARAASAALEQMGVDLILTNQSHPRWCRAVEHDGFVAAESNFVFAASRKLSELLAPFPESARRMHVTRADGDGLPDNF
jgi:hypothetical protein